MQKIVRVLFLKIYYYFPQSSQCYGAIKLYCWSTNQLNHTFYLTQNIQGRPSP